MQNNNIYEYINITNVINQLNIKKTSVKGNYIYAICPFCQHSNDKNGYLKINTISNVYICKKCESSGSSIELYANLKYISTKEAFKRLLKDHISFLFVNWITFPARKQESASSSWAGRYPLPFPKRHPMSLQVRRRAPSFAKRRNFISRFWMSRHSLTC